MTSSTKVHNVITLMPSTEDQATATGNKYRQFGEM